MPQPMGPDFKPVLLYNTPLGNQSTQQHSIPRINSCSMPPKLHMTSTPNSEQQQAVEQVFSYMMYHKITLQPLLSCASLEDIPFFYCPPDALQDDMILLALAGFQPMN